MNRFESMIIVCSLTAAVVGGPEKVFAQTGYPHHPVCNNQHGASPRCQSYAISRAFNRGWSDPRCPASTFGVQWAIPNTYFDRIDYSLAAIKEGDIIGWGGTDGGTHACYVTGVSGTGSASQITIAQVDGIGGTEVAGTLQDVISGRVPDITRRDQPTSIFRKKPLWSIRVQNSYGGGMVGVNGTEHPSGHIVSGLHWESSVPGVAVMDGRSDGGYIRRFRSWTGPENYIADNATASLQVRSLNFSVVSDFTAHLFKEYNVSFQISLPAATGGVIKVKDTIRVAPHQTTVFEDSAYVTADAVYNEINRIKYTFAQWNDGNTANPRTFPITNHAAFTAHYTAKPLHPFGIYAGGPVGANVCVTWQVHPHAQVTQYQIWRKVKHQLTGTFSPPVLLTTVPRTTTQFTDYDYIVTDGYTHDLVSYDVRSFFSVNNTYSDENWVAVFANGFFAKATAAGLVPSEWNLANSPNPFNPTTRITYSLPKDGFVSLVIYDVQGREVARLTDTYREAGYYSIVWSGRNSLGAAAGTGMYFARLNVTDGTGKVLYSKPIKLLLAK